MSSRFIRETQESVEHAIPGSITEKSETMEFDVSQSVAKDDQVQRVVYISVVGL